MRDGARVGTVRRRIDIDAIESGMRRLAEAGTALPRFSELAGLLKVTEAQLRAAVDRLRIEGRLRIERGKQRKLRKLILANGLTMEAADVETTAGTTLANAELPIVRLDYRRHLIPAVATCQFQDGAGARCQSPATRRSYCCEHYGRIYLAGTAREPDPRARRSASIGSRADRQFMGKWS